MKFTEADLRQAMQDLSTCSFYPTDEGARASIQFQLAKMCPSREALMWLADTFMNRIGRFSGGVPELRAVLATKYKPADRQDTSSLVSTIPGFRPFDAQELQLDAHEQLRNGGILPEAHDDYNGLAQQIRDVAGKKKLR